METSQKGGCGHQNAMLCYGYFFITFEIYTFLMYLTTAPRNLHLIMPPCYASTPQIWHAFH